MILLTLAILFSTNSLRSLSILAMVYLQAFYAKTSSYLLIIVFCTSNSLLNWLLSSVNLSIVTWRSDLKVFISGRVGNTSRSASKSKTFWILALPSTSIWCALSLSSWLANRWSCWPICSLICSKSLWFYWHVYLKTIRETLSFKCFWVMALSLLNWASTMGTWADPSSLFLYDYIFWNNYVISIWKSSFGYKSSMAFSISLTNVNGA